MRRFLFGLTLMLLTGPGCSDRSPLAPTDVLGISQQPLGQTVDSVTIQGRVYARQDWGEPLLSGARILVRDADGFEKAEVTDADGFYHVSVRPGDVTISASSEGFEEKAWTFALKEDTVLNFGLTPR